MREQYGNNSGFSPVKEGEEHDVKIEAVGDKGDGVAKIKGFVVFIPGVREGDEVKIRVTKVLQKVGFAEVVGKADKIRTEKKPAAKKVEEKPSEEEQALFDTSKDSEDFGDESNDDADETQEDDSEEKDN